MPTRLSWSRLRLLPWLARRLLPRSLLGLGLWTADRDVGLCIVVGRLVGLFVLVGLIVDGVEDVKVVVLSVDVVIAVLW